MTVSVDIRGILGLADFLQTMPAITRQAASIAMNDVIGGTGLARYRKAITAEVNLPPSYVDDSRFGVNQRARPDNLTTTLIARQRPTSLARFSTGGAIGGKGGVSVKVKRQGGSKFMKSAFLVRLKAGSAALSDNYNVGLAIRLKPGQTLNKRDTSNMVHLERNVVLLYGPSIDQILNNSVIEAETPEVLDATATEFFRQFARLAGG